MQPTELGPFFRGLEYYLDVSRQARQSLAQYVAPSFSVFDYLQPDEVRLSKIIADLMNPKGNHGQGATFLTCFMERLIADNCKIPEGWQERLDRARIVTEASTSFMSNSSRRIDIRIELPPFFGIGIENKPWALEQRDQLSDYVRELERRYSDQFVIVFLCQKGRTPQSIATGDWERLQQSGKCVRLNYSGGFLAWLNDCYQRTQADKVRHFLNDFSRYVQSDLGGTEEDEDNV
jgi:hypothetical protein